MSSPWKKSKSGRILRFISEFQQSRKRGGSLFVETGFPASLIDIFFKNRDRFKKPTSKRFQRIERQIQTAPNASSQINNQDAIFEKPVMRKIVSSKIKDVNFVESKSAVEKKETVKGSGCVWGGSGAVVLMAFKVFIVAMLALSTKKKLTIGITLSAFVLLLTELVAARVFTRSKISNTKKNKNAISQEKIETFGESKNCSVEEVPKSLTKSISCLEETKPVVAVTETPKLKDFKIRDLLLKDEKFKSKSSRLKSKIVKKLRSYKKKKQVTMIKEESLTKVSSLIPVPEDKTERIESQIEEKESNPPLMESSKEDQTNGIVLIVIVLTGLLCGKILAFVLTLTCLVLRFGAGKNSSLYK